LLIEGNVKDEAYSRQNEEGGTPMNQDCNVQFSEQVSLYVSGSQGAWIVFVHI